MGIKQVTALISGILQKKQTVKRASRGCGGRHKRIMSFTGNRGAVLAVGLIFLSLCCTGRALQCYTCNGWMSLTCETKQECASPADACTKVTRFADGSRQYGCRALDRCTIDILKQEIGTENFELRCCQSNLCNGSFMASPSTVLILSLAAVLLLML